MTERCIRKIACCAMVIGTFFVTSCSNKVLDVATCTNTHRLSEAQDVRSRAVEENEEKELKSIYVALEKPSDIKVYCILDGSYQLLKEYSKIYHNKELSFYAPSHVKNFMVLINGKAQPAQEGTVINAK